MQYRIGIGYDIHQLVAGRKLFLGGIEIPYIKGLWGHSDADVLLHAICDAILGALGLGDIGELFPNTDPKYHNISSVELLKEVSRLMQQNNYQISNVDTVAMLEEPRLFPFKEMMRKRIAEVLGIKEDCVNIKAKTGEKLGEIGREEAIAGYAVVLLSKEE